MMELLIQSRACPACGKGEPSGRVGGASLEARVSGWLCGVRRERSGLAHASGFAGVLYLFRYSLVPLALSNAGLLADVAAGLFLLSNLLAPLAFALSVAAALTLDRSPGKSGVLPALFGFAVGTWGMVVWLVVRGLAWEFAAYTR